MWRLGINPPRESGLVAVDVEVFAEPHATVADFAAALGRHLVPSRTDLLIVPVRDGLPWPATQRLAESGLRSGDVCDVVSVPASWLRDPQPPIRARARLRVIAGPDLGLEVGLVGESATIGRAGSATVRLSDPLVSRRHARLQLHPRPVIVDDGSAYGIAVAGTRVTRPTPIEYGAAITLGDSVLVLDSGDASPTDRTGTGVLRPPRFGEPLDEESVDVAAPPTKPKPQPPPWLMMLMPMVLGLGTLAVTRNAFTLVYLLGYPVLVFGGYLEQRRRANKEHRQALKIWFTEVREVLDRLDHHAAAQRVRADEDHPDGPELHHRVPTRHAGLWGRVKATDDFLSCRVGVGPVQALMTAKLRDGGDPEARAKAAAELARRGLLADLPVPLLFAQANVTAVVGPPDLVDSAVRAMLIRLCVDHSPADVSIAGVLGVRRAEHETWLRWLPHAGRRVGGLPPMAVGPVDGAALLDQLALADSQGVTICLLDADAGLSRRQVEATAQVAGDRLRLVWLGDDAQTVPAATVIVVDLTGTVPTSVAEARAAAAGIRQQAAAVLAHRDRAGVSRITAIDVVSLAEAWQTARAMTAYTDEVALLPAETALPEMARLPEIVGDIDDPDSVDDILSRWRSRSGLRAPIGVGVDGVVTIDLRDDGPHGLVAGTTGSGKSELLQTLICSLALGNPPDRISFLLVDYKGGAAFRECADLPHTVGYITDLTPALVTRALTSLYAEVSAREELLAHHGAKDLVALERDHPDEAPPSLLICVDEFAALTAEVPDFVDGMVNIAQRGRSLGMHLILATQRPAGVITPNIRANTDLRIALRVASTDDSNDVLNRPDAGTISRRTPGRAWLRRTGHGTDELVQVAWVGARARLATVATPVRIRPFTASLTGAPAETEQVHPRTDLERLVSTIGEALIRSGRPAPDRPWLPALPDTLALGATDGELLLGADAADAEYAPGATHDVVRIAAPPGQVPVGLVDQPARRAQPALVLDYPQVGHVLIYGASGSGKTEVLRTLTVAATLADPTLSPHVYGIDFGGGGLATLMNWPTVGSIVSELEIGRVLRLLRMLRRTVAERNQTLAAAAVPDLAALVTAGTPLPRIHLLIDNLPSLLEALETNPARRQHADMLTAILSDGRRVGVHITATTPRRSGIPGAMQAAFGERLVLRMTTEDDYSILGVTAGVLTADSPPGRGLLGRHECQIATVGGVGTPDGARRFAGLAARVDEGTAMSTVLVLAMPTRVPYPALPAPDGDRLAIGVESEFLGAVTVSLTEAPLLIAGRARSGRTGILTGLAELTRRSSRPPREVILVGPRAGDVDGAFDQVITDPAEVVAALPTLGARGHAGDWSLLLVDDAHVWERAWETGGAAREAVTALASSIDAAAESGLAIIVATDVDEARSRQHVPGVVTAARRGRRGVLLQPDFSDGSLLSVMVPSQTSEPMIGPGRGLYCANGSIQVVQFVGIPE